MAWEAISVGSVAPILVDSMLAASQFMCDLCVRPFQYYLMLEEYTNYFTSSDPPTVTNYFVIVSDISSGSTLW